MSDAYEEFSALPNDYIRKCGPKYDNEREIFQVTQMEAYNKFGTPCNYFAVDYNKKYNKIWGEDGNRMITDMWSDVMVFYQFQRDDKLWSKFGIEDMSNFSMYMSKEHFNCVTEGYIPQMGDLIHTEYNDYVYEIVERKETAGMMLQSKRYTWELVVRTYKVESNITLAPELSASPIAKYVDAKDIYDISDEVDVKKEDIIYKPKESEQGNKNPFGNW